MIYMDYAAATPVDADVLTAMQPYFTEKFYNPSALYLDAKAVHKDIETARASVAKHLGARPGEVVFTAGGTEANNLAIHGVMQAHPGAKILVSSIEHESVLKPAHEHDCQEIPVDKYGVVDVAQLEKLIDDETVLISVMQANNEIGTIQPIAKIAGIIEKKRKKRAQKGINLPIYLHTDACQAANYLDIHTARLGVDLLTLNGGKIYGPKQSGVLYIKAGTKLQPQTLGGGQENGWRSGTENVPAIMGLSAALDKATTLRQTEVKRLSQLQSHFLSLLKDGPFTDGVFVNGSLKQRSPNNVHVTIPGQDNERLIMALDEQGILAAAGSACSASNEEPSHVLRAIGLTDQEAQASLRFTMGRDTTEQDIIHTVKTLAKIIA